MQQAPHRVHSKARPSRNQGSSPGPGDAGSGSWSGGLIALFHRFDRLALGWDAQLPRILDELLDAGIDGVFSDYVDRMTDALARL